MTFRLDLIRHANAVNDQLLEMLRITSPSNEALKGSRRQFNELRSTTYRVLLTWLQELGDASGLNSLRVCTELVQEVICYTLHTNMFVIFIYLHSCTSVFKFTSRLSVDSI